MALTEAQREQRRQAGAKGGAALSEKYGREYMAQIGQNGGKKGGRPTRMEAIRKANERDLAMRKLSRPGRPRKEMPAYSNPPGST